MTSQTAPTVSVIMPAQNHGRYVGEAIQSVLTQSWRDLELIVIDDGTTDGTAAVINSFDDSRIRVHRQVYSGSSRSLNHGISMARGEFIAIINSDDRYDPKRIATLLSEASRCRLDFVLSDFRVIDDLGDVIHDPIHQWLARPTPIRRVCREASLLTALLRGNSAVSTSNFVMRRSVVGQVGPFRRYRYVQDWEYALRAALQAPERVAFIDQRLFDYRLHDGKRTLDRSIRCHSEIIRMYAKVLGQHNPVWREPLVRVRTSASDLRRRLYADMRALRIELGNMENTVRAQTHRIAEQEKCIEELAHDIRDTRSERDATWAAWVAARAERDGARSAWRTTHAAYQQTKRKLRSNTRELKRKTAKIQALYGSTSWRLTRPLRGLSRFLEGLRRTLSAPVRWPYVRASLAATEDSRNERRGNRCDRSEQRYSVEPVAERVLIPGGIAAKPVVSVIIPVRNNLNYTLACLDAISRTLPQIPIEVLIVDDCSTDGTQGELSGRKDIRYFRNPTNLGSIGSCNRAAREARGEFLFFLHNDTIVLEGWLDRVVATFDVHPDVGLIGSKLIYPDGRLQQAGGIVWEDASVWNWGRSHDPEAPEYNFTRDVDYCSGAALMIRRALFSEIGGFDERYAPAHYKDTDLAFTVRERGLRVVYQPFSRVVHYMGISFGTGLYRGMKFYQVKNRARFRDKWRHVLSGQGSAESQAARLSSDRRVIARILVVDDCTPTPDQDSGSIDIFNYLRILTEFGYRVTFVPYPKLKHLGHYTVALQNLGVECIYRPYVESLESLLEQRGADFDVAMLSRAETAYACIDLVRASCVRARVIFNTVDLHFLRERRRAELEAGHPRSTRSIELEYKERYVMDRADTTVVVSDVEQALLAREAPDIRVRTVPLLREIPGRAGGYRGRTGIVFVGGFRHPPNVDAIRWFCDAIWPRIRAEMSCAELTIVGSNVTPEVQALERNGVRVMGFVENLEPLFAEAILSVAPLRYGAGQKGKVATSLGYGVPCVATSIAAEGFGLGSDDGVLIADEPTTFAAAVTRLHCDAELWQRLSDNGLAFVEQRFSIDANRQTIANLLDELALPCPTTRAHRTDRIVSLNGQPEPIALPINQLRHDRITTSSESVF